MQQELGHCFVTGGCGFLGSYLLKKLQQANVETHVLVRSFDVNHSSPYTQAVEGALSPNAVCDAWLKDIDTVFHLAGTAHLSASAEQYQQDSLAAIHLAQQAARVGVKRFVFVSTTKAAADPIDDRLYDESWDAWPTDAYGYWKRKTEEQLLQIDIPQLVIIRPCLIYGAGVKGNLQKMMQAVDAGYFPPLPQTQSQRSMVFAGDVVDAILRVALHPLAHRQIFIVSDGEPYTASFLYDEMRQALGKLPVKWRVPPSLLRVLGYGGDIVKFLHLPSPINSDVVSRLMDSAVYSSEELRRLGWEPSTHFSHELPSMISAIKQAQ